MKKHIFIAFSLVCITILSVHAQDMSRVNELAKQSEQLQNDFVSKKITQEEYTRRMIELADEMKAAIAETQAERQAAADKFRNELQAGIDAAKAEQAAVDAADTAVFPSDRFVRLHDELYTHAAALNDGRMSRTDYEVKAKPLSDEIERLIQNDGRPMSQANGARLREAGEAVKKLWPGRQPGWPPAEGRRSIREVCNLGPFIQPSGTRASYSNSFPGFGSELGSISIYITGNTDAVYREMRSQIERISGRRMENIGDGYYGTQNLELYIPKGSFPLDRHIYLEVTKDNAVLVEFQRRFASGD